MANRTLFGSLFGPMTPRADARNAEAGPAYLRTPEQMLAQYAATGCLNATFYADAREQLDRVLDLAGRVAPEFVARTAVYARERGYMKDMPALLVASLSRRDIALMDRVFDRVVDNPRMLRTFIQIMRSGTTGRKSLGTAPRRAVRRWLERKTDAALFAASVGNAPSLGDVIRMVHPKPSTPAREALFGNLIGRKVATDRLPEIVRQFETFKQDRTAAVPDVPFQMLTSLELDRRAWSDIARHASWHATRMNLNTFARHGVFDEPGMSELVATKLSDADVIRKTRAFPFQILAAWRAADAAVPAVVRNALEVAMEASIANVPAVEGPIYVCPDVSGSMISPVSGYRKGATTAVRCIDAAALVAAAFLRRNPATEVLPFNVGVVDVQLQPRDRVMANAERLAAAGGGGTSVSAPLARLNRRRATGDLVIVVSDNQSWADATGHGTATMREWSQFRARNPHARLVLIDLQPSPTSQVVDREDVLNIGGFSDAVFDVVSEFAAGRLDGRHWVGIVEGVTL